MFFLFFFSKCDWGDESVENDFMIIKLPEIQEKFNGASFESVQTIFTVL